MIRAFVTLCIVLAIARWFIAPRKVTPMKLLALSLALLLGCGQVKASEQAGVAAATSCAKADVTGLIGQVTGILVAGSGSWQDDLSALAKSVGVDAVKCAVQAAVAALQAHTSALASITEASHAQPADAAAIARGQQYLAGK